LGWFFEASDMFFSYLIPFQSHQSAGKPEELAIIYCTDDELLYIF
jgi:hypothetical protein